MFSIGLGHLHLVSHPSGSNGDGPQGLRNIYPAPSMLFISVSRHIWCTFCLVCLAAMILRLMCFGEYRHNRGSLIQFWSNATGVSRYFAIALSRKAYDKHCSQKKRLQWRYMYVTGHFNDAPYLYLPKKNDILQTIVVVSVQLWVVTLIVFKSKDMTAGYFSFYLHQIWLRTFLWVLLLMSVQVQYWHDLVSKTQLISRNLSLLVKVCMYAGDFCD